MCRIAEGKAVRNNLATLLHLSLKDQNLTNPIVRNGICGLKLYRLAKIPHRLIEQRIAFGLAHAGIPNQKIVPSKTTLSHSLVAKWIVGESLTHACEIGFCRLPDALLSVCEIGEE